MRKSWGWRALGYNSGVRSKYHGQASRQLGIFADYVSRVDVACHCQPPRQQAHYGAFNGLLTLTNTNKRSGQLKVDDDDKNRSTGSLSQASRSATPCRLPGCAARSPPTFPWLRLLTDDWRRPKRAVGDGQLGKAAGRDKDCTL